MVFSSSQHVVICVLYQGQGTIKVCPGCAGHTGHTETQLVPRGSQECDDVFYPAALPLTVGARWNARALEPMPRKASTHLQNHDRSCKATRRAHRFERRWSSFRRDALGNAEQ